MTVSSLQPINTSWAMTEPKLGAWTQARLPDREVEAITLLVSKEYVIVEQWAEFSS